MGFAKYQLLIGRNMNVCRLFSSLTEALSRQSPSCGAWRHRFFFAIFRARGTLDGLSIISR